MSIFKNIRSESKGFSHHLILPVLVIGIIGLVGARVMFASHAATPNVIGQTTNIPPNPDFFNDCNGNVDDNSPKCDTAAMAAINNARKLQGIAPLPISLAYWLTLNNEEQTFVISNLERIARGVPAVVAETNQLNVLAQIFADDNADPEVPNCGYNSAGVYISSGCNLADGIHTYGQAGNKAEGDPNPLAADYQYMYDDGPGGAYTGCATDGPNNTSTCWEHRSNILYYQPGCPTTYSGAAFEPAGPGKGEVFNQIFVPSCTIPSDETFSWPEALRKINGQPPLSGPSYLSAGKSLNPGKFLLSSSGNYQLDYQTDGNIVVYNLAGQAVWNSNTSGHAAGHLTMQTDGNLVAYTPTNQWYWQSGTSGTGSNDYVTIQNDGNLVIYNSAGAVWDYSSGRL